MKFSYIKLCFLALHKPSPYKKYVNVCVCPTCSTRFFKFFETQVGLTYTYMSTYHCYIFFIVYWLELYHFCLRIHYIIDALRSWEEVEGINHEIGLCFQSKKMVPSKPLCLSSKFVEMWALRFLCGCDFLKKMCYFPHLRTKCTRATIFFKGVGVSLYCLIYKGHHWLEIPWLICLASPTSTFS